MSQFAARSATDEAKFSLPFQFYFQRTADCNVLFCKERIIFLVSCTKRRTKHIQLYALPFTTVAPGLYIYIFLLSS